MWSYYDIANPECQYAQLPLELEYTMDPSSIEDRNAETVTKPPTDDDTHKAIDDFVNDSNKTGAFGDLDVSVNMGGYVVRDILDLPKEEDTKEEYNENKKEEHDHEEDDALLDIKSIENEVEDSSIFLLGQQRVYRDTLI